MIFFEYYFYTSKENEKKKTTKNGIEIKKENQNTNKLKMTSRCPNL